MGLLLLLQPSAPAQAQTRGAALYTTHCASCHSTEMHWRANRRATDWQSLGAQVKRWQEVSSLDWNEEDIEAVTRYLNDNVYQFEGPQRVQRELGADPATAAQR